MVPSRRVAVGGDELGLRDKPHLGVCAAEYGGVLQQRPTIVSVSVLQHQHKLRPESKTNPYQSTKPQIPFPHNSTVSFISKKNGINSNLHDRGRCGGGGGDEVEVVDDVIDRHLKATTMCEC